MILKNDMKNAFLYFFFFCTLHTAFGQKKFIKINLEETVYKDGKTCWQKSGEPLNGKFAIKMNPYQFNNEQFIDGLKNGECSIYRMKKLAEKGRYENNLKEGLWSYYDEKGSLRKTSNFKNGLQDSTELIYYKNKIVEVLTYRKNHLNGWTIRYWFTYPNKIKEKVFYEDDKIIKSIRNEAVGGLNFEIADSLFYNEKRQLTLKKIFIDDKLHMQIAVKNQVMVDDVIQIETTQVAIYEGNNLAETFYFPNEDYVETEIRLANLLNPSFVYYVDTKKPKLLVKHPAKSELETSTFYTQLPNGNLRSVTYQADIGKGGFYYHNVD